MAASEKTGRQLDQQVNIVRLDGRTVGSAVAPYFAAAITAVDDDIALARVGLNTHRAKDAAAGVLAVARIDIHMQRTEAARAVVARAVPQRQDLKPAILTDKSIVIFLKALVFHRFFLILSALLAHTACRG